MDGAVPALGDLTLTPVPTYRGSPATPASDVVGVDLTGARRRIVVVDARHATLLLFLSARCEGCRSMWETLADEGSAWPGGSGVVAEVVVRDPTAGERVELERLAGGRRVIVSDEAYRLYRVGGPPFYALIDGPSARVVAEGVAWDPAELAQEVRRALHDEHPPAE